MFYFLFGASFLATNATVVIITDGTIFENEIFAIADISIAEGKLFFGVFRKSKLFFENRCDIIKMQRSELKSCGYSHRAFFFAFLLVRGAEFYPFAAPGYERSGGMPRKPNVACKHPGCPRLISPDRNYCDEHEALHRGDRAGAAKRGYDSRWQKARARYLRAHPLCVECKRNGRITESTVVDHITPHRGDPILFWDEENWQALCKNCHDKKTMTEDRYPVYRF